MLLNKTIFDGYPSFDGLTRKLNTLVRVKWSKWCLKKSTMNLLVAKIRQSATESPNPKPEVGEIDTSPPFQSVKDVVSLFGEGAFSGEKPIFKKAKPYSAEESDKLADMKVAAAKAQVEAVKASENEALKRLETTQKEIEDIKGGSPSYLPGENPV
ncbi:hypothetical protein JHK87_024611 [Glycine soja]|nr:hypothetical protein JHK87_024611 [Glycine soja]